MPVKILHGADFHMDSPFDALPDDKALARRGEQRLLLSRISDICSDEKIDIVLLAGDLFDSTVSYYETAETLWSVFSNINAKIFISPGNHDFYCDNSPYSYFNFPENVHIFKTSEPSCVELPQLGCRVWGAGFTAPRSNPLLNGFSAGSDGFIELMVLHGDTSGNAYNHISESDISSSGLDYLALGHIHAFSGIKKSGDTFYAYPGCPEGRGFDETGEKGVITGTVDKGLCNLSFRPLGGRKYRIISADVTGTDDIEAAVLASLPSGTERDICRLLITGEYDGEVDPAYISRLLEDKFFHLSVRNETHPAKDIWEGEGEDSLRGVFLSMMRQKLDSAESKEECLRVVSAVKYGIAALDGREEPQL